MQSVNPTALTAVHLFAVMKIDNDPPAGTKSGNWSFSSGAANGYPKTDVTTDIRDGTFRNAIQDFSKSGINLAAWRVVEIVSTSSAYIFRIDGIDLRNGVGGTAFDHQAASFIRLGRVDPFNSNFLDGDLAGLYIFSAELTTDRPAMIDYLNDRFGLSVSSTSPSASQSPSISPSASVSPSSSHSFSVSPSSSRSPSASVSPSASASPSPTATFARVTSEGLQVALVRDEVPGDARVTSEGLQVALVRNEVPGDARITSVGLQVALLRPGSARVRSRVFMLD